MTSVQTQILELFEALAPGEREALLPRLAEAAERDEVEDLSADDIAAIDEGLAEMRRGEAIGAEELFGRLARKFGF